MFEEKQRVANLLLLAQGNYLVHDTDAFGVRDATELEEVEDHGVLIKSSLFYPWSSTGRLLHRSLRGWTLPVATSLLISSYLTRMRLTTALLPYGVPTSLTHPVSDGEDRIGEY